ncbi:MAG: EAL domain-containing protein [Burkholderiales bacterium]|jgi:predicted signal transduction protein with EAL and GGDEF domain|nr:EAL domain-containing protein [Burkholderiales bacterium]
MNPPQCVLVVDDDPAERRLLFAALQRAGFEVIEAADGEQGLQAMRDRLADLVLMDVGMPVMDGFAACAELRKLPGGDRIPVLMMTGLHDMESVARAFEAGASDFLTKPIQWALLPHRVRFMLRASAAINDILEAQAQIQHLAHYDALTGLPNRRLFIERLHQAIANAQRRGEQVALMFIDLDHFKRINDTLGHSAGDELLRTVGARLARSMRPLDSLGRVPGEAHPSGIARIGGDEFIVMLTQLHGPTDAASVARRLLASLAEPVIIQQTELFIGASIGVAMYPFDGADVDTLLKNADTAMYRAKAGGRGALQFYDHSMNARARERLVMEAALRRALEHSEFVLHYQPRVDFRSGRIAGAEALIRWQHPERGLVPPNEFISIAEEIGMITPIGEWAMAQACRQSAAWRAAGLNPGPVAVNLAASHLRHPGLVALVKCLLSENALPRASLEIEVTESMLMADPEFSITTARQLGELGVGLAIDDFGTGYSSLGMLKRLPIAALKIDPSFVRDLASDADHAAIVTAIIAMAHTLKLKVIAEGVETAVQRAFLAAQGCDEFQGYLFSRPIDAQALTGLLETQR